MGWPRGIGLISDLCHVQFIINSWRIRRIRKGVYSSPTVRSFDDESSLSTMRNMVCVIAMKTLDPHLGDGVHEWRDGQKVVKEGDKLYLQGTNTLAGRSVLFWKVPTSDHFFF